MNNAPGIETALRNLTNAIFKTLKVYNLWLQENPNHLYEIFQPLIKAVNRSKAITALLDNQIVFTDDLTDILVEEISKSDNVTELIENYYMADNCQKFNELKDKCIKSELTKKYNELFCQVFSAYDIQHYHLACMGLFAITDGLLATLSKIERNTSYKKRTDTIVKRLENEEPLSINDRRLTCIICSLSNIDYTVFKESHFDEDEPDYVNRHWTLHGRTNRTFERMDFIRVLLWIDALIILDDYLKE